MITSEELIYDLQNQIIRLEVELNQAQQDVKDFESLALVWQDSYLKMEAEYKVKLSNVEQTVVELEKELMYSKSVENSFNDDVDIYESHNDK